MWRDPDVNESGTMLLIFAVLAASMFISGAFKRGKTLGVLSIVTVAGMLIALFLFPGFRNFIIAGFAIFILAGLALSFLSDIFL